MSTETLKTAIAMTLKEIDSCTKEASFTVPANEVDQALAAAIKEIGKQASVEGFRKGKVPAALIKARFGQYITEDVSKNLQQAAIEKAEGELDVVSVTALDDRQTKPAAGKEYAFTATLEIAPAITLPDYKAVEVRLPKAEDAEKSLQERLSYLKELYAEYADTENPAADGDMLKVAYTSDFTPAADAADSLKRMASTDEAWVWLNDTEYVPGANAALKGAKKDDVREFDSTFPADWREAGLAGRTVHYKMTVKTVQHKDPITDEAVLAEKLHLENVDKLHETVKAQVSAKIENDRKESLREKIMETLDKGAGAFDLPKSVIASETEREFSKIANQLVRSAEDVEKFKADKDKHLADAKAAAEKNMRSFFIIRTIAKANKIEVTPEELDAQIRGMSAYFGYKEKDVRESLARNGAIGEMHAGILTGKVLDFLAKTAKVTEE